MCPDRSLIRCQWDYFLKMNCSVNNAALTQKKVKLESTCECRKRQVSLALYLCSSLD